MTLGNRAGATAAFGAPLLPGLVAAASLLRSCISVSVARCEGTGTGSPLPASLGRATAVAVVAADAAACLSAGSSGGRNVKSFSLSLI